MNGREKTFQAGFKPVKIKRKKISIWDEDLLDGMVNINHDIEEYMDIRQGTEMKVDDNNRFFASINPRGKKPVHLFRAKELGEHTLRKYIQKACTENTVVGLEEKKRNVAHSLF